MKLNVPSKLSPGDLPHEFPQTPRRGHALHCSPQQGTEAAWGSITKESKTTFTECLGVKYSELCRGSEICITLQQPELMQKTELNEGKTDI